MSAAMIDRAIIPADFPVRPLDEAGTVAARDPVTCHGCGLTWDDAMPTSYTPAPSARCPFEAFHADEDAPPMPTAPEMLAALRDLYTHCSMIHKYWGDGCNREEADRAIQAGRAILERAGVQP